MEALITVFDWRRQWLTVVCSISSIIWAEDTNWRPGLLVLSAGEDKR